jgi:hypothetical protein
LHNIEFIQQNHQKLEVPPQELVLHATLGTHAIPVLTWSLVSFENIFSHINKYINADMYKKSTTLIVTHFSLMSESNSIHLTKATAKKLELSKRMIDKFYNCQKILSCKM